MNHSSPIPLRFTPLLSAPLAALALLALLPAPAEAVLITFDDYAVGNLTGQPGSGATSWTGPAVSSLAIVEGAGVDGSKAVVAQTGIANGNYRFNPTATDLGEAFSATSSVLHLSFSLAWESLVSSSTGTGRLHIGSSTGSNTDAALYLNWYSNGRIGFSSAGTFHYIKQTSGSDFIATAGQFYLLEVTLDFSSKTYAIHFNGVAQEVSNSPQIAFTSTAASTAAIDLLTINTTNANFRPWKMDSIDYQAIPEPGTFALTAGAFGLLLGARLRRRRS